MTTLLINDLPLNEELGSKAMTAVRGGMGSMHKKDWYGPMVEIHDSFNKKDYEKFDANITQSIENVVGNNIGNGSAFFGKGDFNVTNTVDNHQHATIRQS
jgi:hypothetical protein